jgi:F-type H+-transporting ATPase subunit b
MAVDAFTLIAQVVNFVVLLLLLRQFLFRPIRRVMAERERRIAEEHAEAERARGDAETQAAELRRERAEFEALRRERLAEVQREVERARRQRFAELRAEAEAARAAWHEDLDRQYDEVEAALRRGAAAVMSDALRRGWRELADADLEARALEGFGRRLRGIDDATRSALAGAAASGPVVVTTAFEPTEGQREVLVAAARDALGAPIEPTFELDADLLAGVTLRAGDLRVEWSVRAHVDELERTWREAIGPGGPSEGSSPGAPSEPEAPALPAGES